MLLSSIAWLPLAMRKADRRNQTVESAISIAASKKTWI
jgi:hypothetical protein